MWELFAKSHENTQKVPIFIANGNLIEFSVQDDLKYLFIIVLQQISALQNRKVWTIGQQYHMFKMTSVVSKATNIYFSNKYCQALWTSKFCSA